MKIMSDKFKKLRWITAGVVVLILLYSLFNFAKDKIIANNFFENYEVLTVTGDSMFAYNAIELNGKVIEKTEDGWTNVLPIPNTLKYILMTSSYSKGHDIKCGDTTIPKRVEMVGTGENEWCLHHNDKDYVAITSSQYYHYDENDIVYERCLKSGYYEGINGGRGFNGCAENGLFLNDKQIATAKEKLGMNYFSTQPILKGASTFNYYPSKKLKDSVIYTTELGTHTYNVISGETKQITDRKEVTLEDIFVTKDDKVVAIEADSVINKLVSTNLGITTVEEKTYNNLYSAEYADGHFYLLRLADVRDSDISSSTSSIYTFELLRDGQKIENIELSLSMMIGYSTTAIQSFPLCDNDTIVCIYEEGHYAYKNRSLIPDVFSYDFYPETMVIDGEWRGEHIPNYIGRSKPIFENGKLKYLVYADAVGDGLYLVDFDKKWDFKKIFYKSGPVTKLLGGHQNDLLNVMNK